MKLRILFNLFGQIHVCWFWSGNKDGSLFDVPNSDSWPPLVLVQSPAHLYVYHGNFWNCHNMLCCSLPDSELQQYCACSVEVVVQLLSRVQLFVTPWTAARQASLSITNSQSLPKLMSIESVMPSNHLILCCPLLLLPSIFPNIRVFSNESALCIRWPKYWSFSFNISPSN